MTESMFSYTGKLNSSDLFTVRGNSVSEFRANLTAAVEAIASAIESIYDADNVYPAENESEKSILEFIESLTSDQFKKIVSFFDDMPKLKHDIDFTCTHCKEENKIAVEGLQNFF
jgi:hypothetical protein